MSRSRSRIKLRLKQESVDSLVEVLVKIIGETVKDKLIRAALVGAVAAGGSLVTTSEAPQAPPPVGPVLQK